MSKLRPLRDRVIIEIIDSPKLSKGDILLIVETNNYIKGKVLAVGSGHFIKNQFHTLDVNVGDIIILHKDVGTAIELDGKKLRIIREEDIMAIES